MGCYLNSYGNFKTLNEAKFACVSDNSCEQIVGNDCKSSKDFSLCSWNTLDNRFEVDSCLHEKPGKYGTVKTFAILYSN